MLWRTIICKFTSLIGTRSGSAMALPEKLCGEFEETFGKLYCDCGWLLYYSQLHLVNFRAESRFVSRITSHSPENLLTGLCPYPLSSITKPHISQSSESAFHSLTSLLPTTAPWTSCLTTQPKANFPALYFLSGGCSSSPSAISA